MSDSESLNSSLPKVMISSKNERFFICHLNNMTLQIIFDACCASMDEGSKRPIASNDSRQALSCRFYSASGIEVTSSPDIICIVCNQVLHHLSQHKTSSKGKYLLAKAHIRKLNEFTETQVTDVTSSTVDGTALAILKRQGSRGISIVSLQRKIRFDIQFGPY
jgi:hypothetical protein